MNEVITLSPFVFGMLCFCSGAGLVAMFVAFVLYLNKDIGTKSLRK